MNIPRPAIALLFASIWIGTAPAQIDYTVSFDLEDETWTVEGTIANPEEGVVDFWMPRWTGGSYHLAEFGRFITKFEAFRVDGEELDLDRKGDCQFVIAAKGCDEPVVRYEARSISRQIFSDGVIDVESNRITKDYAFLTPVSLFGFVPERIDEPISLQVNLPEGWDTATVLERDDEGVFHSPNYYHFEDSPLIFAPDLFQWEGEAGGKPLEVTIYGKDEATSKELVDGCVKIVEASAKLMRGLPYDRYRFLIAFVPESGSGASGLEHSDSTLILSAKAADPEDCGSCGTDSRS